VVSKKLTDELVRRYPQLSGLAEEIARAASLMTDCFLKGNKLLVCGNGGSSSDSDHIAGELLKGFENQRPLKDSLREDLKRISAERGTYLAEKLQSGLPVISLSAHTGVVTAVSNDTDASLIYAQQVAAFGRPGDVLVGISTSGNAANVIDAAIIAKALGMTIIGMTGRTGGRLKDYCDILLNVPESRTAYVQELHLPVYHTICLMIEEHLFGTD
jgi:D-sedoheptulose 7-phosphate isomerase